MLSTSKLPQGRHLSQLSILTILVSLFLGLVFAPAIASAAGVNPDPGFTGGTGFNGNTNAMVVQSDGRIIVVGSFTSYNGTPRNGIARLNADGTLDASFNPGAGFDNNVRAVALQSDGRIVVGGDFTSFNGTARSSIVRLNPDGSLDSSFNPGSGFNSPVFSLAIQSDGRIVAGGNFTNYNGTGTNRIARLNLDGSLDTSLAIGAGFNNGVLSLAIQPDGRIVAGGFFTSFNGSTSSYIARLNTNGSLDSSFNTGSGFNGPVFSVALQPDGRVLAGGQFFSFNGINNVNNLARLNTNGSLDGSFNTGTGFDNIVRAIVVQPDGSIVVGGYFTSYNGTSGVNYLTRLGANGTLDSSFTTGTGYDNPVSALALQTDGKVLAGGLFTTYNGTPAGHFTRLLPPPPATKFLVTGYPSPTIAGVAHSVTVTAADVNNNPVTGYTGTVQITFTDPKLTPITYTFVPGDSGSHIFTGIAFQTVGTQTITATDTGNASITGAQTGIIVNPGPAATLTLTATPNSIQAGQSVDLTVTARDAFNNIATGYLGTVTFTGGGTGATLPTNYTFLAGDNGTHTFTAGATLRQAGIQTITVTDTVSATLTASTNVTVAVGPLAKFAVAGYPSPVTAGTPHSVTVTAQDAFNNTVTGYTGTVNLTFTDPLLTALNYTFTTGASGDNGIHTFNNLAFQTAGNQNITATDSVTPAITGQQTGIVVNPGAVAALNLTAPASTTAGAAFNLTVTARDAFNNVVPGYAGTVSFSGGGVNPTLPANYPFVAGDNGTHTFTNGATLRQAGNQTITVSDGTLSANATVNVLPGAPASLVVSGYPSPVTAGTANNVNVTVQDASGNTVTGYLGTISFTSSDANATLPVNYTFVAGDNGTHSFSATFQTAGTQSITATDTGNAALTGQQTGIVVNPAAVANLTLTATPNSIQAGQSVDLTVTARDAFNNIVTGYTGTVNFSGGGTGATLPAAFTFSAANNGTHTFPAGATLLVAGNQTITVSDGTRTANAPVQVTASGPTRLVVNGYPSPVTAGTAHNVSVTVQDNFGNTITSYTGTVQLTFTDAQLTPVNYTFVAGDNGAHSFSVTFQTAGTQTINAADTGNGAVNGQQTGIVVNPGAATRLGVAGYPSPVTAGTAHNFTVTAYDAFNNVATGYPGTVTFTGGGAGATLPVNYTFVAGDNGTHTFSATMIAVGLQALTATDTGNGALTGTQNNIQVNAAAPSSLRLTAPPVATAGVAFNLTVAAYDAFNNVVAGYNRTVSFGGGGVNPTLPANYPFVAGDNGTHTFTNGATLRQAGNQLITVSDGTLNAQASVTVSAGASSVLVVTGYPSPVTAGSASSVTVTVRDAFGNPVTNYTGTVQLTFSDPRLTAVSYTFVVGDNGTHTFTGLAFQTAGAQSITATDTGNAALTGQQTNIQVIPGAVTALRLTAPANATAGIAFDLTVTAYDAFNNVVTGYTGTVNFTGGGTGATLPAAFTFTVANNGARTFTGGAMLITPGNQTITVSDGTLSAQAVVSVVAGAPAKLLLVSGSGQGVPRSQAFPQPLVVQVTDAFNNPLSGLNVTFTAPATGASASLSAPAQTGANGQTQVNATANNTVGGYNVVASSGNLTPVKFSLFNCGVGGCTPTDVGLSWGGPDNAVPGQQIKLSLTVRNYGPAVANTVQVKVTIPKGLNYLSNEAPAGTTYDPATGLWQVGDLANGASFTLSIGLEVTMLGQFKIPAEITSMDQPDSNPANNLVTFILNGVPAKLPAEVSAQLRVNPDRLLEAKEGTTITLNFTGRNVGPGQARLVYAKVPFDPTLFDPAGSSFPDKRDWVKQVVQEGDVTYLEIRFHDLNIYEQVSGSVTFRVKAGVKPGTNLNLRFTILWDDDTAVGRSRLSNLARLSLADQSFNLNGGAVYPFAPEQASVKRGEHFITGGDFFSPEEKVEFWYTKGEGGPSVPLGYAFADKQGKVSFELRTADLPAGVYNVSASGYYSQVQGATTLTVREGEKLSLNPPQATIKTGETLKLSANCFSAGEKLTYWYTGPDGKSSEMGYAWANENGEVNLTLDSVNLAPGEYILAMRGNTSGIEARLTLTVVN